MPNAETKPPNQPEAVPEKAIYDGDRIIQELDGSGNLVAAWDYGVYIDEILVMYRDVEAPAGLEPYYYLQDDHYNVIGLADANGTVVERYAYDDYGAPTIYTGDGTATRTESAYGNPFLFQGRRWDEVLSLYDYRTRYYDPKIGRFLRIDTIGLWGDANNLGNPYAFVGNNPWTHLDPYGEGVLTFLLIGDYNSSDWEAYKGYWIGIYDGTKGVVKGGTRAGQEVYYALTDFGQTLGAAGYNAFGENEVYFEDMEYSGAIGQLSQQRIVGGDSGGLAAAKNTGDIAKGVAGFLSGYTVAYGIADAEAAYRHGEIGYYEMVDRMGGAAGEQAFWTLLIKGAELTARPNVRTGRYGDLSNELRGTGEQANHLNQNAAYRSVVAESEGLAHALKGDAVTQPGTPHFGFHASLESFWHPYRKGQPLYNQRPTNAQYGQALKQALRAAGLSRAAAAELAARAARQRAAHGLLESDPVPRIPGRLPQKR